MTHSFDDDTRDAPSAEHTMVSPTRRKIALGLATLPFMMMAKPSFAAAPPTSKVNTTGLAITDTTVTVGQLHSATGTMAISETG